MFRTINVIDTTELKKVCDNYSIKDDVADKFLIKLNPQKPLAHATDLI